MRFFSLNITIVQKFGSFLTVLPGIILVINQINAQNVL